MPDDIILNKADIIERCIRRINEEYAGKFENLHNYTKQDSIILNIQRATEACIDLAMHLVAQKKLGIPQNSRDAFELLQINGLIPEDLSKKLKAMVGFRNIAVHNYQVINVEIIRSIIEHSLDDMREFITMILRQQS